MAENHIFSVRPDLTESISILSHDRTAVFLFFFYILTFGVNDVSIKATM